MKKKWLNITNALLFFLVCIFLILALFYFSIRPGEIQVNTATVIKRTLPKRGFAQSKDAYEAIGNSLFKLKYSPMTMQLPDLRKYLVYYGKNERPDAKDAQPMLHLAFTGNKTATSVPPGEKIYVLYDRESVPPQYIFSPGNAETALWIQATATDREATIKATMRNENGEAIQEPWSHSQFTLPQKEFIRSGTPWEIGKWRVDGSLLARQKARWYGVDRFLENHGGQEFSQENGKQRIDFGEGDQIYSVFVGLDNALIWDNDRWKTIQPGPDSLGHPLLTIKKIEDRLMQLELWDSNGQSKISLNLLRSTEPWMPQTVLQNFKFLGSRTRSQFVFEVNKERIMLSPKDWLVLSPSGWKKLSTAEDVDDYVNRKLVGILFVFEGIERKADQQFIKGILYNSSRSEAKAVEIPVTPTPIGRRKTEAREKEEESRPPMPPPNEQLPPEVNYPPGMPIQVPVNPVMPKKFEQSMQLQN